MARFLRRSKETKGHPQPDQQEPWVNFSRADEELDYLIILREDRQERVHIYRRTDGSFGCRNFVWIKEEPHYEGWTVGSDWGHFYDSVATALREARGRYEWLDNQIG